MNNHTPGPWQWYWREEDEEASCGVFHESHHGMAYSICRAPRYQNQEQWQADARLIAAAPDLLEALEDIFPAVEYSCDDITGDYFLCEDQRIKVRAAIAKARGEQP